MSRVQQQMVEKELQVGEMTSSVQERQLMLQQSQTRIAELEEGQSMLEEQVCESVCQKGYTKTFQDIVYIDVLLHSNNSNHLINYTILDRSRIVSMLDEPSPQLQLYFFLNLQVCSIIFGVKFGIINHQCMAHTGTPVCISRYPGLSRACRKSNHSGPKSQEHWRRNYHKPVQNQKAKTHRFQKWQILSSKFHILVKPVLVVVHINLIKREREQQKGISGADTWAQFITFSEFTVLNPLVPQADVMAFLRGSMV